MSETRVNPNLPRRLAEMLNFRTSGLPDFRTSGLDARNSDFGAVPCPMPEAFAWLWKLFILAVSCKVPCPYPAARHGHSHHGLHGLQGSHGSHGSHGQASSPTRLWSSGVEKGPSQRNPWMECTRIRGFRLDLIRSHWLFRAGARSSRSSRLCRCRTRATSLCLPAWPHCRSGFLTTRGFWPGTQLQLHVSDRDYVGTVPEVILWPIWLPAPWSAGLLLWERARWINHLASALETEPWLHALSVR